VDISFYTTLFNDRLEAVIQDRDPENLYAPVNYIMGLGGKRIRPSLALMSCHLFGSDPSDAFDAAMAVEMFHNFTLIHDDIMDRAELRRGQMTVHRKWDLNAGILSGDVLMILSYRQLESYPPKLYHALMKLFNKTAIEVCEGQQMDIDFETRMDVGIDEYFRMIRFKTAVLLGCSLAMGAMIAGASEADCESIYEFGIHLGLAFQLQDDYLDSFGGADFGKKIGGDILERKKTLLFIKAVELADDRDREALISHYSTPTGKQEDQVDRVRAIFRRCGTDELLLHEIERFTDLALERVDRLSVDDGGKELLRQFCYRLMKRKV
jgi:geranylgeranyl diphosphate synthase type II